MKQAEHIPRARIFPVGMAYLSKRNPWAAVWWSVALPGFGHLFMGQHMKGAILMSWEIAVNHLAHMNLAIYYSMLGQYDQAREVIDYRWALIYPLFYVFAMYDSYRVCVELNALSSIEKLQKKRSFQRISLSLYGTTALSRRRPDVAAFWSGLVTGFGQLYCDRTIKALFLMAWYLVVVLQANLSVAAFHTLRGEFDLAKQVVDYQWLLFWPSIYIFGIADAYHDCVEMNNLTEEAFRYRVAKYLRNEGPKPNQKNA